MSAEDNAALVHRFFDDVFNGGNPAAAPQIIAADFVAHHPAFPDIVGLAGLRRMGEVFHRAVPDLRYAVEKPLVASGDRVAVRWTARGNARGPLELPIMEVPAPEKPVSVTIAGTDIFRIAGGQIVESWTSSDFFGLMVQLGVLPPRVK